MLYTESISNSNLHTASDLLHIIEFINYHKFSRINKELPRITVCLKHWHIFGKEETGEWDYI